MPTPKIQDGFLLSGSRSCHHVSEFHIFIHSHKSFIPPTIYYTFLLIVAFRLQSARTILCSEIPGMEMQALTSEGLLQQKRSRKCWPLVDSLCTMSFSFRSLLGESSGTSPVSQSIPPALNATFPVYRIYSHYPNQHDNLLYKCFFCESALHMPSVRIPHRIL